MTQMIITIIGFVVTICINNINTKKQVENLKKNIMLDNIQQVTKELCDLIDKLLISVKNSNENQDNEIAEFSKTLMQLQNKIISYGSKEAIEILAIIQQNKINISMYLPCLYAILITQLKYDITGEVVPANYFLKIKLNDFKENEKNIKEIINKIIENFKLNTKFKV